MTNSAAFDDLTRALLADPDDDVTAEGPLLLVKDAPFALLDGDVLVVDLPEQRADDLVGREVALPADGPGASAKGRWIAISDTEDWRELASEAHQFIGEPAVGNES